MLAAVAVLQAAMPTPGFQPPLDAPIRIVMERVEMLPAERRYRLETAARFARDGDGYRAEVRIVDSGAQSPAALASMVEHGFAAMAGRTIVMHLDPAGRLTAIDDLPQLWERFCQAVADNAVFRPNLAPAQAAALSARIAAPLRAFPDARQRETLGGLLSPALAIEPVDAVGTRTAVRVPGASPLGGAVMLIGTRDTKAVGPALVEVVTLAEADVAMAAEGSAPARTGHVALERRQRFDPATGMVVEAVDSRRTTSRSGTEARTAMLVTTTRVERGPAWQN